MEEMKLGAVETRFAEIVWEHAPLSSRELVALCEKELEWKKSTTYTVLKKLCARGLFENTRGTVTVCVTKEEFDAIRSEQFVEDTFEGSLPAFIAAFTKRKALTEEEVALIRDMIESHKEG